MMKKVIYLCMVCMTLLNALVGQSGNVWSESVLTRDDEEAGVVEDTGDNVIPEIFIKMVNPGYTVDNVNNVGEAIEIGKNGSNEMVSLAGLTVGYTNSSGNYAVLAEFPENSFLAGESLLLRLASSPEHELAALNYTKTLAFKAGPLVLVRGDEIIDSVCWTNKDGCEKDFKSSNPTVLVRDELTGNFAHLPVDEYDLKYDEQSYYVDAIGEEGGYGGGENDVKSQCKGMIFSEILSYYEETQREQFIELYNTTAEQILLDGCQIRYKNKTYGLSGIVKADTYVVRYLTDFSVTKNPTNIGRLELIDINGEVIGKLEYPNGQKKGTSWAFIGYDANGDELWRTTYAPTPGEANNYQEFRTCEVGKIINEVTGNCVKVTEVTEKVCPDGQYLNPLTGRCKKLEETKETVCKEGYYLNEETGRCKKIVENNGADYSLVTETYEEKSSFVALSAIIGVLVVGSMCVVWQFRSEIRRLFGKVFRLFR